MRPTLLLFITVSFAARADAPLTVDQIVSRYVEARGGDAALASVKSMRITGKAIWGTGDANTVVPWGELITRSGKIRDENTLQGLTSVDAFDGKEAWRLNPFGGRRDPERSTADGAKGRAQDADIDGPLVHWKDKGHVVEYLGTEDVDGTQALKLRIKRKDGDVLYVFLDPASYLDIREESHHFVRGVENVNQTDLGGYQQVGGVWFPFEGESGPPGTARQSRQIIDRIELNVDAEDALFGFPAPGTKIVRAIFPGKVEGPAPIATPPHPAAQPPVRFTAGVLSGLGARNIGSARMSGRIAAVAARLEGGKTTIFVGAASGGVWRSKDDGTTFKAVFDKQPVQSIGAIALDPSNAKTVWVGSGEAWTRNSVSIGDGIYKSTDDGETWHNMGLPDSERIARIIVSPKDGDTVYACVPGKLWSDGKDRGVYKTTDGGKSWQLVLAGKNLSTGCGGLAIDPRNPDVLFAGLWDFRRKGWTFRSGGDGPDKPSGSGLYRTADGGKTWTELTPDGSHGIPAKPYGRIEVAVAPSDPNVVYAFIESTDSALFRSSDGGKTWDKRDKSRSMVWRPFYFARLVVDPTNPDRLFKPDGSLIASDDGGKSFTYSGGNAHGDWHDIWIDPSNPKHVIGTDDGGLWISFDGGNRWWKGENLPVSQFYHVAIDDQDPYRVYGGLQDNGSWTAESSYPGGVTDQRWETVFGNDGFWAWPDPSDPKGIYAEGQGGFIVRLDRVSRATRDIQPKAGYHEKLRYNWNTPIAVSPNDKNTLYLGAQFLFRSKDKGDTWQRISPDLTTNDPEKQKQEESGGVTVDNSSAEMHTTIYAISESPKDAKLIWVGTDDGNVQLTRDGGKSWTNLVKNIPGLPANAWVSWIEASRHDKGSAVATFDRHTFGDMAPYVFRTKDFGKTWTRLIGPDSGVRGYAHVVKQDPVKPDLFYVGTEFGLWITLDAGATWAEFKGGDFPSVAVRDLAIHPREGDLVIATHGRGIWVIDDLSPLRALDPKLMETDLTFLPSRPVQQRMPGTGDWAEGDQTFVGDAAPGGATVSYYQRSRQLYGRMKLEVLDPAGKVIDTLPVSKRPGINRVTWTMRLKPPRVPRAVDLAFAGTQGPRVVPGRYTLRLTRGTQKVESPLDIAVDRRAPYGVAERKANFDASMRLCGLFGDMSVLIDRIEAARGAAIAQAAPRPPGDPGRKPLDEMSARLDALRKKVVATKEGGMITGEERLREYADQLYGALVGWEGRPGRYQLERIDSLSRELADVKRDFDGLAPDLRKLGLPTDAPAGAGLADGTEAALWRDCAGPRGTGCEQRTGWGLER